MAQAGFRISQPPSPALSATMPPRKTLAIARAPDGTRHHPNIP
ncbi:MAG: hypothetical protein N2045_04885 [Fimbriimonadales bacterium]|nr:hypothetical protein [Fimbriimonadales bacterium]